MLIDRYMPKYEFSEVHAAVIRSTPGKVVRAIKEITPSEVPFFRTLMSVRSLPAFFTGRSGVRFERREPLLNQVLRKGFVLIAEDLDREVVLGTIGQFWKLRGGSYPKFTTAEEFLSFDDPSYAKAVINFFLADSGERGMVRLSTETRIHALSASAQRMFRLYWQVIYPGSAFIRKMWLKAIRERAESYKGVHGTSLEMQEGKSRKGGMTKK